MHGLLFSFNGTNFTAPSFIQDQSSLRTSLIIIEQKLLEAWINP